MEIEPGIYNRYVVYKGADFGPLVIISDPCGEPIDLTGYDFSFRAKYSLDDVTPFIDLTTDNGGITVNSSGEVQMIMPGADTADLETGDGEYSLIGVSPGGETLPFLKGDISVEALA